MAPGAELLNDTPKSEQQSNGVKHQIANEDSSPTGLVDSSIPVTKLLAEFTTNTTFDSLPKQVVDSIKTYFLDYIGNAAYGATHAESSASFFKAISTFSNGHSGNSTVLTKGQSFPTPYAALLNAAFAHSLDFDDTFAAGALHPGVTCISAAIAQAEATPVDGQKFINAVAVGYEVNCRIAAALNTGGYARGFHNTATAGIFGAVAAAAKVKGLNAETIEASFGLAESLASGSMQYLVTGAWNKRLHPGFAAHNALLSITLAEAGVDSAKSPIEGKFGLLNGYSSSSTTNGLIDGLGKTWRLIETSIKPYPGCRITHGAIDLAANLRDPSREVKALHLAISSETYAVVGAPQPNKTHPANIVDAQFSAYYQLAVAWLDSNTTGLKAYDRLHDSDVHNLTDRITITADPALEGLATRLTVTWADGGKESTQQLEKTQVRGEKECPMTMDKVSEKFSSLAVPVYGDEKAAKIAASVEKLDKVDNLKDMMTLVA